MSLEMPFGLGGNSVKLTQPNKNGGENVDGELAIWWQGGPLLTHLHTVFMAYLSAFVSA
jgi:hypothetical protein